MKRYQVSLNSNLQIRITPGKPAVVFFGGTPLPEEAVRALEQQGDLNRCILRGFIKELGAPEMPRRVRALVTSPDGSMDYQDGEVRVPVGEVKPGYEEVEERSAENPMTDAGPRVPSKEELARHATDYKSPWAIDPTLLLECSVMHLNAIIKDKDPKAPVFELGQEKEALKFLSQDWVPPSDAARQLAVNHGIRDPE